MKKAIMSILLLLIFTFAAQSFAEEVKMAVIVPKPASGGGLLKTGQTIIYHAASGTDLGDDGVLHKGSAFSYTPNGDNTVTDNVTGLMWIQDHSAIGIVGGYDWRYTGPNRGQFYWDQAYIDTVTYPDDPIDPNSCDAFKAIAALNAMNLGVGYAGHHDWRMPNMNELLTLSNYSNFRPAIGAVTGGGSAPFTNFPPFDGGSHMYCYYWSSTANYIHLGLPPSDPSYSVCVWVVDFDTGGLMDTTMNHPFFSRYWVRPVRGGT